MELIKTAINGDLKAFVIIRDMLGESPITKTEVTNKNTPQIQKVFITPEQQLATARHMKAMLENC